MSAVPAVILGLCPGCKKAVVGGQVTVSPEGEYWHPDCRASKPKRATKRTEASS
jgi:hypothetical protein